MSFTKELVVIKRGILRTSLLDEYGAHQISDFQKDSVLVACD
jgi:predicted Zn-dependent protease